MLDGTPVHLGIGNMTLSEMDGAVLLRWTASGLCLAWMTRLRSWDASTAAKLNVLNNSVRLVAFSMDGMRIVSGSDKQDCAGMGYIDRSSAECAEWPHLHGQLSCIFVGRSGSCLDRLTS